MSALELGSMPLIWNDRIEGALNAGFVLDGGRSLKEHAVVWEMNLENEIEDMKGPHLSPQPQFGVHF